MLSVIARVEGDHYANSSRAAKNSKKHIVAEVLRGTEIPSHSFCIEALGGHIEGIGLQVSELLLD